jgi:hypothetical protein
MAAMSPKISPAASSLKVTCLPADEYVVTRTRPAPLASGFPARQFTWPGGLPDPVRRRTYGAAFLP